MVLNFDLDQITLTEFGIGRDNGNGQAFVAIPVETNVQAALQDMAKATWASMQDKNGDGGPIRYEPSEKHGATEYLYLPLADDMASFIRELHSAANLAMDAAALSDPSNVFCYFIRLLDRHNRHLTALRRATQFKGILKSAGRLVRMLDDSLRIVEDTVFKLDTDFDLLVDSVKVHILRPSGFEFAGKLQEAILGAVPENIRAIEQEITFVDFTSVSEYAADHPRAARYLASIRGQEEMRGIDKAALKRLCQSTGVAISQRNGKVLIARGHEMGFLEVLDRRRYKLELVKGRPETFRAASRKAIDR